MNKHKQGFTFIEVVLVLGIAGVIFMMAFIALPSLWASQRDADRKARVMEFISDLKTYQTNNSRGSLPTLNGSGPERFTWSAARASTSKDLSWENFVRDYIDADFSDASGNEYEFYIVDCLSGSGTSINVGEDCAYKSDFGDLNSRYNIDVASGVDFTIYVAVGATCDGNTAVKTNSNRNVAAIQVMERGGRYCYNT
ncbi:type II secretion system protein [Candidatus Saccharibacteria bacterium]|nr:type II secretion system protein [Candidatus Saccharibacteria bacterium]